MTQLDATVNLSQCLKTKVQVGHDLVYNICSGTVVKVPWGTADWFTVGFLVIITLGFVFLVGVMCRIMLSL